MEDLQTLPTPDSRQQRYEQLIKLLRKWSEEDPAYDTMVMDEIRKAADLTMRCRDTEDDVAT